jgi:Right handed beta helix region
VSGGRAASKAPRPARSCETTLVLLVIALALSLGLSAQGFGPSAADRTGPTPGAVAPARISSAVTFASGWTVDSWVNESDVAISVTGNVVVESGGHLSIANSTLTMVEAWNLDYGVAVDAGGSFTLTDTDLQSSPSTDHTYVRAMNGSTLRVTGGRLSDIGGNVATEQGLYIGTKGATVSGTTFNQYYEAVIVSGATGVHVSGAQILNCTSNSTETFAVDIFGSSSGFELSYSTLDIPQEVGALSVASPSAKIFHNTFELNPYANAESGIYFAYADNGVQNASGSSFDNNTVTGSGFIDEAGSEVTIWGNSIYDTGPNRPYGIMVEVPLYTDRGLWVNHLAIEWNTISDYSRYGIRLQQNVSAFVVSHNTIEHPSTDPGPWWTELWGGPQIDAMYLIRGVQDGLVQDNYVDDSDTWYIATDGITLESDVSDVRVLDNQFYNVSQEGVVLQGNVPGFDNALPWECGPSLYDTIANNLFDNERAVSETNFTVEAILDWQWANHTTVVNNTFVGWEKVPTGDYFNGAIVLTTGSYGFYYNNTVEGARYGFVFTNFTGVAHPHTGEFNRSYNLVYGNFLSGITVASVDETSTDGMGPLHNVIVALSTTSSGVGLPSAYVESISNAALLSVSDSGGSYTEVLRTASPITGVVQPFTTWESWSDVKFSIAAAGTLGTGAMALTPTSLTSASVGFGVTAAAASNVTVSLYPTGGSYTAVYNVSLTVSGSVTRYKTTVGGPVVVDVGKGTTAVDVVLLSFWGGAPTAEELVYLVPLKVRLNVTPVSDWPVSQPSSSTGLPASWQTISAQGTGTGSLAIPAAPLRARPA